jgi:hypothetical protein
VAAPDLPTPRPSPFVETLSDNGCKARYGVAYVQALCSQAGVGFDEVSVDEDVIAIDGSIQFDIAAARVQIKATSQFTIAGKSASWPVEIHWRDAWSRSKVPVYFVLVIIDPKTRMDWLRHSNTGTLHRAAAYWTRVDLNCPANRIKIDKYQRLEVPTFHTWYADVLASFGAAVSDAC